ncbi:ABC transporter ATP-binding protein [Streptomyces niveus]|uniref:ABC transporter ATP-binding protein n=1 Tax=Streptomyces niveus TaxID=193462 RepID=UPI0033C4698B
MLLDIEHLTVQLPGTARPVLTDVTLRVASGEVVGLVGESGSGKSTTANAALRLLPGDATATGRITVDGTDVLSLTGDALRAHRSRTVAMVHQDPRSALNPVRRVGDFLTERLRGAGLDQRAARVRAVELLAAVGLSDPERRVRQRPHELSGGMLQRVVIAGALAAAPRLLLADEATSALDVTTQAEILALLKSLRTSDGDRTPGMLFITHDLQLAAAYCDRVYVMYAGRVVEEGSAGDLFARPRHPYTRGLLDCSPTLDTEIREIRPIPGRPPSLADAFTGCEFAARCPWAEAACETWRPEPVALDGGGTAACRRLPVTGAATATATDTDTVTVTEGSVR